jgi:hypothetical protein
MELIPVVVCSLGFILALFLYIFAFRVPAAQINAQMEARLADLYADTSPGRRTTLLLRSREPKPGELVALVVWLDGYEIIDTRRQILAAAFEHFAAPDNPRVLWREVWEQASYEQVQRESWAAYRARRADLEAHGWRVTFELEFSHVDALLYLHKSD